MSFSMATYQQTKTITAGVFIDGRHAILHFDGDATSEVALHVPPAVAKATAKAFNKAMAKHNKGDAA